MRIILNSADISLLERAKITFNPTADYSEDEALQLLERVYDEEVFYAQDADTKPSAQMDATDYAHLADKIQVQIPAAQ